MGIDLVDSEVHVTEALVRVLEQAGIDTVFGLSGGNTGRIFSRLAFHTDTIRVVLVRNEAAATIAAEAYAKVSGKPAVAMAQGSWLVGQGIVGTLEALSSGTPLILLGDLSDGAPYSQHAPYQAGSGDYGTWDARMAYKAITKLVLEAYTPEQAVQNLQLAIKHAASGTAGPVAVLFHSQSLTGNVGPDSKPKLYATERYVARPPTPRPDMSQIARALREADAPILVAGGGVRHARAESALLDAAIALGAPVVTTAAGKGTFPEEHALAGGVFGNFGSPAANELLATSDVVLVLGSRLSPSDTANGSTGLIDPARQHIIQVDLDERSAAWTVPVSAVVVADARAALAGLAAELEAAPVPQGTVHARTARVAQARASAPAEFSYAVSDGTPIHPQRLIADLRSVLPDNAIVCADAGENRLLMCRYFQSRQSGVYLQPSGAGGMGYAIPAALGAKVCAPDRVVVAVCGDGGFSMSLPAVFTAIEEDLPIVIVMFNNGALGWVKHSQRWRGEQEYKSSLDPFDYAAIGSAFGLAATRVTRAVELVPALTDALKAGGPALVTVDVSTAQTFLDLRTPLLA